jgi:hypothetical protein
MQQNRFYLGSEHKRASVPKIIKWFDAEPIPRAKQPAPPLIPDPEAEHSAKSIDARITVFFEAVQNRFRVAPGRVDMAIADELLTQNSMVVDLAVIGDVDEAVLVRHRLASCCDVDDCQTPVTQMRVLVFEIAGCIRSAMGQRARHAAQELTSRSRRFDAEKSCYAAHVNVVLKFSVITVRKASVVLLRQFFSFSPL